MILLWKFGQKRVPQVNCQFIKKWKKKLPGKECIWLELGSLGDCWCPLLTLESPLSWVSPTCKMNLLLFPEDVAEVPNTPLSERLLSCSPRALCLFLQAENFFSLSNGYWNQNKNAISWQKTLAGKSNISVHKASFVERRHSQVLPCCPWWLCTAPAETLKA